MCAFSSDFMTVIYKLGMQVGIPHRFFWDKSSQDTKQMMMDQQTFLCEEKPDILVTRKHLPENWDEHIWIVLREESEYRKQVPCMDIDE